MRLLKPFLKHAPSVLLFLPIPAILPTAPLSQLARDVQQPLCSGGGGVGSMRLLKPLLKDAPSCPSLPPQNQRFSPPLHSPRSPETPSSLSATPSYCLQSDLIRRSRHTSPLDELTSRSPAVAFLVALATNGRRVNQSCRSPSQASTNGSRGGKLPSGNATLRSPARSFSAAARNAARKRP
jgi:hypothetical protein